jgi:hypothetical protein
VSSLRYEARLAQQNVMVGERPHYHQWLHDDLDFCDKYSFAPAPYALVAKLLYGSGLRFFECLKLCMQALSSARDPGAKSH